MIGTNGTRTNGARTNGADTNGSPNQFSTTKLVGGILSDFQDLVSQQLALIKAECLADWQKTKTAGVLLCVSLVPLASGTILLAFMFAHLLHWVTMPAGSDPATLPLWACYGIAGVLLAGAGAALFFVGWNKWQALNPLHGESIQAFEENVHWLKAEVGSEEFGVESKRNA